MPLQEELLQLCQLLLLGGAPRLHLPCARAAAAWGEHCGGGGGGAVVVGGQGQGSLGTWQLPPPQPPCTFPPPPCSLPLAAPPQSGRLSVNPVPPFLSFLPIFLSVSLFLLFLPSFAFFPPSLHLCPSRVFSSFPLFLAFLLSYPARSFSHSFFFYLFSLLFLSLSSSLLSFICFVFSFLFLFLPFSFFISRSSLSVVFLSYHPLTLTLLLHSTLY